MGWIGLGAMGLPMATRLLAAGYELSVCGHRTRGPLEQVGAAGALELATPREVAEGCDVVVTMVRDEAQTDEVVRGPDGVLAGLAPGSVLIAMSTLSPGYCRALAAPCAAAGISFLDAPVSGGSPGATAGTLAIMVGGEERVLERCRQLLERLGSHIFLLGDVGAGQRAKIVNNAIKIGLLGLVTEGLALGLRAGLDPDVLVKVLVASSARSQVLERWDYYARFKREHRTGGPLDILYKDIGFALEMAEHLGVDVPLLAATATIDVGRMPEDDAASGAGGAGLTVGDHGTQA